MASNLCFFFLHFIKKSTHSVRAFSIAAQRQNVGMLDSAKIRKIIPTQHSERQQAVNRKNKNYIKTGKIYITFPNFGPSIVHSNVPQSLSDV